MTTPIKHGYDIDRWAWLPPIVDGHGYAHSGDVTMSIMCGYVVGGIFPTSMDVAGPQGAVFRSEWGRDIAPHHTCHFVHIRFGPLRSPLPICNDFLARG